MRPINALRVHYTAGKLIEFAGLAVQRVPATSRRRRYDIKYTLDTIDYSHSRPISTSLQPYMIHDL